MYLHLTYFRLFNYHNDEMNLIMENDENIYDYSFVPQNIQVFALTSSQRKLSWWYYKTFISQQLTADFQTFACTFQHLFLTLLSDFNIKKEVFLLWNNVFIHRFLWHSRLWVIWLDSSVGRTSTRCAEVQGLILRSIIFFCSVLLSSVGVFYVLSATGTGLLWSLKSRGVDRRRNHIRFLKIDAKKESP